ncbi:hypothetical protein L4C38_15025 [Vibrio kasasachensis]|uniref:hypothetical protein n=1 Tax=Vibrio kasasachensis TaxID=2910248 RepID=UPI003D0CEFCE
MKNSVFLSIFFSAFISIFSHASTELPIGAFGVVSVDSMTQGQLFWLKGRIGEARYTTTTENMDTCTILVPVVVGNIADSGLGIENTEGLTIVVMSQQLNDALMQGERIRQQDWHFTTRKNDTKTDGLIVKGIGAEEGFVLNSKRRWFSWFMSDKPKPNCLYTQET